MADLSRGAYADVVEHALAAAALATRPLGVAALAATYAGDLDQARVLNDRMAADAASPTLRAFGAYVAGEIDNAAGRRERAVEHYARVIELARSSGATFVIGIASVGLLTVRADAGRVHDALRGYRDVIDYWARSGNWTQQWVTLRNSPSCCALARRPRAGGSARHRSRVGTGRTRRRRLPARPRHGVRGRSAHRALRPRTGRASSKWRGRRSSGTWPAAPDTPGMSAGHTGHERWTHRA